MRPNSKKLRRILAVVGILLVLVCGLAWRYWIGPNLMLNAITQGDVPKAKLLVRLRIDPNADVFLIGGLMHCAAARGQTQMMAVLYSSGADLNRIDGWGGTPSHAAVEGQELASLKWLLAHGADSARTNRHGLTVKQCITNRIEGPQQEEFLSVVKSYTSNSIIK